VKTTSYAKQFHGSNQTISTTRRTAWTTRKIILRLLRFQHRRLRLRRLRLATLGGSSSSRTRANYRQRSGARHQLAPECEK
jgi:hypothetical protein